MDKLQDMWNKQYDFDKLALKNARIDRKSTITARQVALITELGELFNEMQNFKFWKKNKIIITKELEE